MVVMNAIRKPKFRLTLIIIFIIIMKMASQAKLYINTFYDPITTFALIIRCLVQI
jgi:hypothetical protein